MMNEPRCIAQLLHNNQATRPIDFTITHGKGRQGVVIRQPRRYGKVIRTCLKAVRRIIK